ncbi:T9SS type A sorting domain-containing protein [Bacteroidota bacterium]
MYVDTNYNYAIYPYNSMVKRDNTIMFCGQIWGGNGNLGFVMAINKYSLDTLWTRTYTHPDTVIAQTASDVFSVLTAIKSTPDGGYILTGNYNKNCITGNLRSFLMKIDSIGNVEWRRTYDDIYGLYDIEITPNNGYVLINKNWGPYVVETDSIGNIIWQKKINNNTLNANVSDMTYSGNNSFTGIVKYLSGGTTSNPIYGLNIFKVDLNNQLILWDKTFQLFQTLNCISLHQAMGVETLADGSIIVSGTADKFGHDAVIFKLNSNGDSLWCKSYDFHPDPYDCQLNDLIVTNDGGFMGVGFWSDQAGPGWTAWMFKTDSNGVLGFENKINKDSNLKVYPNPASSFIKFELPKNHKHKSTLTIFNALAQQVYSGKINASTNPFNLNLKSFKAGVYFYELYTDDETLRRGKFVKN